MRIVNFELCRGYAKEAMKCAIKLKLYKDYFKLFHEFSFRCNGNCAIIHEKMGRFDEALELLHQTLVEIDGQKEYIKYQIITLKRMGNLRIKIAVQ